MNVHELVLSEVLESAGFSVFYPRTDRGIDCVVTARDGRGGPIALQVKGSRMYETGCGGCGWFQVRAGDLTDPKADYLVFVWPTLTKGGRSLEMTYLLIAPADLRDKLASYGAKVTTGRRHNLYFVRDQRTDKVFERRGMARGAEPGGRDYSKYVVRGGDWGTPERALESPAG
ncbi:MAG: hypothetical protein FJ313_04790 [Gemmatimonadetes bacterium]|nr:hypothetical protein [Gemmatimonadota bacterium]